MRQVAYLAVSQRLDALLEVPPIEYRLVFDRLVNTTRFRVDGRISVAC